MSATPRSSARRRRLRLALLALIALLYVLSVPWYRRPGAEPRLWLGLPDWVTVALVCYGLAGVLNVVAWQLTEIVDPPTAGSPDEEGARPGPGTRS